MRMIRYALALCLLSWLSGCESTQNSEWKDRERLQSGKATDGYIRRAVKQLEESPNNIWRAGEPLGQYGKRAEAAIPVLIGYLDNENSHVRGNAAEALGNFGPLAKDAAPKLEELLMADQADATDVARALVAIQGESSIPILISYLSSHPKHGRGAATELAKFTPEALEPYGSFERGVKVILGATPARQSTREPLWVNDQTTFIGQIKVGEDWHVADLDRYGLSHHDITHVITTPGGQVYRMTPSPSASCAIGISLSSTTDILRGGGYDEQVWAQAEAPDFEAEGIYKLRLEGEFSHPDPQRPTLPYVSNEVTFELAKGYPTREEIAQMEDADFRRQFPLGRYYVAGSAEHTGKHGLIEGLTLRDAVFLAERSGFARGAIRLAREAPEGKWIYESSFEEIMETDMGDRLIEDGDIIYIMDCLVEGAQVLTEHGEAPVESLRVGDFIVAFDPATSERSLARVNAIFVSRVSQYLRINGELEVTSTHVLYADDQWRRASELAPGMMLIGEDGQGVLVHSIEQVEEEVSVYDLSIDAPHTYFAEGLLVHNKII